MAKRLSKHRKSAKRQEFYPGPKRSAKGKLWENVPQEIVGGRRRKFETALDLAEAIVEYFHWNDENPIEKEKVFNNDGVITRTHESVRRVMTLTAMQSRIGISGSTWEGWRTEGHEGFRSDLLPVIIWAQDFIRQDKYEGGVAGQYHAAIIMRDLGLAEKSEVTGTTTATHRITADMDAEQAAEAYEATLRGGKE